MKTLITIPRLIVIALVLFVFVGLGQLPFAVYVHPLEGINSRSNNGEIVLPTAIVGTLILIGLFFLTYKIGTYFQLLFIDQNNRKLSFIKPFLFKKQVLTFDEIVGFHFSHYSIRGDKVKLIIIKTTDNKLYKFSDFEISNFRAFENYFLDNFVLIRTDFVTKFSEEEKTLFITNTNRKFNLEQAREFRFVLFMLVTLVLFMLFLNLSNFGTPDRKFSTKILIGLYILLFYFIYRLYKQFETIKNCC